MKPSFETGDTLADACAVTRAARADGLTWSSSDDILNAVREELLEVRNADNAVHHAEEIGDVLWSVIGLACHYDVDPEAALRSSVEKFRTRWQRLREFALADGVKPADLSAEELDVYWKKSK